MGKGYKRFLVLIPMALLIVLMQFSVSQRQGETKSMEPISIDRFLLDTYCTISIYEGGDEEDLQYAAELLSHFDSLFSPQGKDSDIRRINEGGLRTPIDRETAGLFSSISSVYESAGGDLELTIEPLSSLWDIKERKLPPSEEEVEDAREKLGYMKWHIEGDEERGYELIKEVEGLRFDVGAVAKGYIADRIKEELLDRGVSSAIINLGGNVLCIGGEPSGEPFYVGIREPAKEASEWLFKIEAEDISVVTAGIYERYFEYGGRIYHHILDPKTGYPSNGELASVTVTGESSAICDALATTLFVKGREEGLSYLREYNESYGASYTAYFIDRDMNVTCSDEELEKRIETNG